jgi:hypothetical protein
MASLTQKSCASIAAMFSYQSLQLRQLVAADLPRGQKMFDCGRQASLEQPIDQVSRHPSRDIVGRKNRFVNEPPRATLGFFLSVTHQIAVFHFPQHGRHGRIRKPIGAELAMYICHAGLTATPQHLHDSKLQVAKTRGDIRGLHDFALT